MPRVIDELDGLRASLQERITTDFEEVLRRRRRHRRRQVILSGTAVVVVGIAGGFAANSVFRTGRDSVSTTPVAAPTALTDPGRGLITSAYPPCGSPSQQLLTLDAARAQLGSQLAIPTDSNANASNVDAVALCPSETIITFKNGVWIYLMPPPSGTPDWKKAVAADPNESQLGTVNGRDAWVITPDEASHRRGSVTFISGGTQFIVEGNTRLSPDELLRIAASIPSG